MRDLPKDSGKYLSALRSIHSFDFVSLKIEPISTEEFHTCFSAFRKTLTHLSLSCFVTSFSMFVTLVDYFPNITVLQLATLDGVKPDEGPVPPLSRPLRGKIIVRDFHYNRLEFINRLAGLDLEYEELVVSSRFNFMRTKFLQSTLQLSASTVKYLRLTFGAGCEHPYRTPSVLRALT